MVRGKKSAGWAALFVVLAIVLGVGTGIFLVLFLGGQLPFGRGSAAGAPAASTEAPAASASVPGVEVQPTPAQPNSYVAASLPEEMRAMWISFIEWRDMDFSGEGTFRAGVGEMFQNCANMGLNTVIVSVRPFGDALYKSAIYPHSHVMTGAQGQDPGFDPLAVMVQEAHTRSLRIEAWANPYRVMHPTNGPDALSNDNPAAQNPTLVREVNGELWYNPALPEVESLVVDGVREILQNYDVDGIHFDDYFYPSGIDDSFDEENFAQSGAGLSLADWRRANVDNMVQKVCAAVRQANPTASFGISMQGNNENNYTTMYADVKKWMATEGFVDYVMPQLYWGFAYRTQSGREDYAYENITAEWAFYPRLDSVRLYAGLGAYRIGILNADGTRADQGDGGNNPQDEWDNGHNLADMVQHTRTVDGFDGFALFRYEFLYQQGDDLAASERAALQAALQPPAEDGATAESGSSIPAA